MIHPLGELLLRGVWWGGKQGTDSEIPAKNAGNSCLAPVCSVWFSVRITGQLLFPGLSTHSCPLCQAGEAESEGCVVDDVECSGMLSGAFQDVGAEGGEPLRDAS